MKYSMFSAVIFVFLGLQTGVRGAEIDPEHKDDWILRIHRVMEMNGALQPDDTAIRTGANEWTIDVELVELPGRLTRTVEARWQELLRVEHKKLVTIVRGLHRNIVPSGTAKVTEELAEKLNEKTDTQVLVQQGSDHKEIRKWILDELLTKAGRVNASFFLEGDSRKPYDYLRLHFHDASGEVIGQDVLIIRGVQRVIIVRIDYVHS